MGASHHIIASQTESRILILVCLRKKMSGRVILGLLHLLEPLKWNLVPELRDRSSSSTLDSLGDGSKRL
jgi:hypothetical protein